MIDNSSISGLSVYTPIKRKVEQKVLPARYSGKIRKVTLMCKSAYPRIQKLRGISGIMQKNSICIKVLQNSNPEYFNRKNMYIFVHPFMINNGITSL